MWMIKDAEWWFSMWTVRRMRRRKRNVDGRGCRLVVQLVDCEKE